MLNTIRRQLFPNLALNGIGGGEGVVSVPRAHSLAVNSGVALTAGEEGALDRELDLLTQSVARLVAQGGGERLARGLGIDTVRVLREAGFDEAKLSVLEGEFVGEEGIAVQLYRAMPKPTIDGIGGGGVETDALAQPANAAEAFAKTLIDPAAEALRLAAEKLTSDCDGAGLLPNASLAGGFFGSFEEQMREQKASDNNEHIGNARIGQKIFKPDILDHRLSLLSVNQSEANNPTITDGKLASKSRVYSPNDALLSPGLIRRIPIHPDVRLMNMPADTDANVFWETANITLDSTTPSPAMSTNFSLIPQIYAADGSAPSGGRSLGCTAARVVADGLKTAANFIAQTSWQMPNRVIGSGTMYLLGRIAGKQEGIGGGEVSVTAQIQQRRHDIDALIETFTPEQKTGFRTISDYRFDRDEYSGKDLLLLSDLNDFYANLSALHLWYQSGKKEVPIEDQRRDIAEYFHRQIDEVLRIDKGGGSKTAYSVGGRVVRYYSKNGKGPEFLLVKRLLGISEGNLAHLLPFPTLIAETQDIAGKYFDVQEQVIPLDQVIITLLQTEEGKSLLERIQQEKNNNPIIAKMEEKDENLGLIVRRNRNGESNVYVVAFDLGILEQDFSVDIGDELAGLELNWVSNFRGQVDGIISNRPSGIPLVDFGNLLPGLSALLATDNRNGVDRFGKNIETVLASSSLSEEERKRQVTEIVQRVYDGMDPVNEFNVHELSSLLESLRLPFTITIEDRQNKLAKYNLYKDGEEPLMFFLDKNLEKTVLEVLPQKTEGTALEQAFKPAVQGGSRSLSPFQIR